MTHHKNPTELTPEVPTKIVFMTPEVKPGFT
jgi:hypothetical protein